MERPLGITVLAIVALIQGLLGLLAAFGVATVGGLMTVFGGPIGKVSGLLGWFGSFFLVLGPIFQLLFAWGAFGMQPWAWWLGIIGPAFTVFGAVLKIMGGAPAGKTLLAVAIPILIFLYLLRPSIRQAFGI
jgi:hypothetical protein